MTVSLASKFESLLDSANAERPLLSWFKRNPSVLADMFRWFDTLQQTFHSARTLSPILWDSGHSPVAGIYIL